METSTQEVTTGVINGIVEENDSGAKILDALERRKEVLDGKCKQDIDRYIKEMRPVYAAMLVDDFSGNTAGLYDGSSIYIDRSVLMVGSSMDDTIEQATEVKDHEEYHKKFKHTAVFQVMAETKGEAALVVGGVEYAKSEIGDFFEGNTVSETGQQFVSREYVGHASDFTKAIDTAGLTVEDVEKAVLKKDLTLIDDRQRVPQTVAA